MKDFYKYATSKKITSSKLDSYKGFISPYIDSDGDSIDVFTKLISKRTIFLGCEIDSDIANIIKAQLLYLDEISNDDITMLIDTGGGDIYTSLGIIDMFDWIKSDISTINVGLAASMGAILLAYGTKGKRKSFKRSRVMIHQPLQYSGDSIRQATDIEIDAKEINSLKEELIQILSEKTGKSIEVVKNHAERDYWLNSKQALEYGLIDQIITKRV